MNFDQQLGTRIRALRTASGVTQEQVAESMGVAVSTVSRLERGVSGINTRRLPSLANALGVTVADIFETECTHRAKVSEFPPSLNS